MKKLLFKIYASIYNKFVYSVWDKIYPVGSERYIVRDCLLKYKRVHREIMQMRGKQAILDRIAKEKMSYGFCNLAFALWGVNFTDKKWVVSRKKQLKYLGFSYWHLPPISCETVPEIRLAIKARIIILQSLLSGKELKL